MVRLAKLLILCVLLGAMFPALTRAQTTYNAASCTESAVQAAYATEQGSAADGDIIAIPTCTGGVTWSTTWSITPSNTLTFQGNSTTTGTCAPGGTCTATDNTVINLGNAVQFKVTVASGKEFRLTGLSINPSGTTAEYGSLSFACAGNELRIDHNHFNDTDNGDHTIEPDECNGVEDHNYFDSTTSQDVMFTVVTNVNGGTETNGMGDYSWTQPEDFGSTGPAQAPWFYVENNFFTRGAFVSDCQYAGRIVLRFNTVWYGTSIQTHGTGSGFEERGCRALEIYGNTFTYSNSPNTNAFAFLLDYESGAMMFWGNTVTAFVVVLREQTVRADNATYPQTATPNGWGYCGTSFSGLGSVWDGNKNLLTGYPCLDQVGRGAGGMLTGLFPNLVSNLTGTIAWPNQALVPTYVFDNTQNTNTYSANHLWGIEESPARVTENQDYYLELPNVDEPLSFNGSAGTGSGALASRPSTCKAGVAYWATDQGSWNRSGNGAGDGELFICGTSGWPSTPSYIPYTYPHPLVSGGITGGGTPPAAPTGLSASVQ